LLTRDLEDALYIRGDEELLTQMFSNLIENAIRHTPQGSSIRLSSRAANGQVLAAVSDDGPGVPADERDKVLRRFYRTSTARSTEGHGLGLSLVAAIVQLHGGILALDDAKPGLQVELRFRQETPPRS
jgi:signal transduction histidine kinase